MDCQLLLATILRHATQCWDSALLFNRCGMGLGYEVMFHSKLLDGIYCTAMSKLNTIVVVFRWLNNTGANKPHTLMWTNVGERLSLGQFRYLQYRWSLHHGHCNDLMNSKWSSAIAAVNHQTLVGCARLPSA